MLISVLYLCYSAFLRKMPATRLKSHKTRQIGLKPEFYMKFVGSGGFRPKFFLANVFSAQNASCKTGITENAPNWSRT